MILRSRFLDTLTRTNRAPRAGFTFSFPMIQHSLDVGILVTWTKSFNCPDAMNKDVVRLLREALDRRGDTRVTVVAVLNDTTGTLVQGSTLDRETAIGLILGTGSNACYLEQADRVEHWEPERHGEREVSGVADRGPSRLAKRIISRQLSILILVPPQGHHRHRVGRLRRQRRPGLHQDGLRSRERRQFPNREFIHVSERTRINAFVIRSIAVRS